MRQLIFCLLLIAGPVAGQQTHTAAGHNMAGHNMADHTAAKPGGPPAALPLEPGQGAFAALAEIVALLRADANTDWNTVDIAALRDHLLDMDHLVTQAQVRSEQIAGGAVFYIALSGSGGAAASRMVPAHGPVLALDTGWNSQVDTAADELRWQVTSDTDAAEIRALGFFGLMAVGGHHQAHHMAMATGQPMH